MQKYDSYQYHSNIHRLPSIPLAPITVPWPFTQWRINILCPFPMVVALQKFLIVVMDYFTKWVEAEPLATITKTQVQKFVKKNIIVRFRVLLVLITDNGC